MNTVYGTPASPRLARALFLVWALVWIVTAIEPLYPQDWLLENMLVAAALPLTVWAWRRKPFTDTACWGLFLFFCLHALGAHYTYSEVPYDAWWQTLTGETLSAWTGWQRNHFDRAVHLFYGLLLTPVFTELLLRVAPLRSRAWMAVFVACFLGMQAMVYELIEWGAVMVVAPELGMAYLGTQGDIWDAHRDMALATLGNLVALAVLWRQGRLVAEPRR
ncbi:MAG: DUF2238 domain-containing protein [Pseudomonadota bacterium]